MITGQKVGYARVSSRGQSLDVQLDKLKKNGCLKIYKEKLSGTDQNRPKLNECLDYVRSGDTLIVTKLDRIARSVLHLKTIADQLEKKKVDLIVLDQKIDTTTSQGKLMFNMLSAFAEFENDLRQERQADGIRKALDNGVKFGRPNKINDKLVMNVKKNINNGYKSSDIMKINDISRSTYFKIKNGTYDYLLPDDYKPTKSISLTLDIEICGITKFVRGINSVRTSIEFRLRDHFNLIKVYKNSTDYQITIEYINQTDLEQKIEFIYDECYETADLSDCHAEIDLYDKDGNRYYSKTS